MIVIRDIFQLHFGKAKEATALLKEGQRILASDGYSTGHLLVDVTGEFYTLVMESTFESLAAYESGLGSAVANEEWQSVYKRFVPLVRSGRREVYRIVE